MSHVLLKPGRSFTRIKDIESRCRDPYHGNPGVGSMHLVLSDEGRVYQCTSSPSYVYMNKEAPEFQNSSPCAVGIYSPARATNFWFGSKFFFNKYTGILKIKSILISGNIFRNFWNQPSPFLVQSKADKFQLYNATYSLFGSSKIAKITSLRTSL